MLSPEWWLGSLERKLLQRQSEMQKMNDYFEGCGPLPFVTRAHLPKIRNEFRQMLEDSRANFMGLVVDATKQRLRVDGFRLSASSDEAADQASWATWQANQMDSESQIAFTEALVKGMSYLSVWLPPDGSEFASIAVEDPLQTIVGYEPGTRRRAAALKVWKDEWTGTDRANVYLPSGIFKFEAAGSEIGGATVSGNESTFGGPTTPVQRTSGLPSAPRWKPLPAPDDFVENPLGVVPIVALRNRPRLLHEGESEISSVYRIQDQINGFLFLLALAGYMGAHRQRWAIGIPLYDEDNKALEPFDVAVDKLWATENPNAKFGDFEQTSLDGYLKAIDQKVQHIAITTFTPKHFLLPEGQEPSGDAIKGAEAGLVKKVQDKQVTFGEGLEEAMRLARRFEGEGDTPVDSEILWADAQIRTEAEVTDAAIKRFQVGLSTWDQTCRDVGYSPQAIARMLEAFGGVAPTPNDAAPVPVAAQPDGGGMLPDTHMRSTP
jgi:hypothetical protein